MKEFWYTIQFIFTILGGWLGCFLGGCDGLLIALVAFAAIDYVMKNIKNIKIYSNFY